MLNPNHGLQVSEGAPSAHLPGGHLSCVTRVTPPPSKIPLPFIFATAAIASNAPAPSRRIFIDEDEPVFLMGQASDSGFDAGADASSAMLVQTSNRGERS
jgi:hypothetical protein